MEYLKNLASKFSLIAIISVLATSSAFATGGTLTFSINSTAVPTLSGTMLVILSLLLFVVAFRIAKQKTLTQVNFS